MFSWGDSVLYSWKWVSADIHIEDGSKKKTFASTSKTHNGHEDKVAEGAVGWSAISSCRLVVPWLQPGVCVCVGEYARIFVMLLLWGSPRVIGYNFHLHAVRRSLFSNIMPQAVSLSAPYASLRVCMQIYSTASLCLPITHNSLCRTCFRKSPLIWHVSMFFQTGLAWSPPTSLLSKFAYSWILTDILVDVLCQAIGYSHYFRLNVWHFEYRPGFMPFYDLSINIVSKCPVSHRDT